MTKDILVSIKGLQIPEESQEEEQLEVITNGSYFQRNGKIILNTMKLWRGWRAVSRT